MMTRVLLALLLLLPLASCSRTELWRQELILRIDTPWGVREGRTVTAEKINEYQGPLAGIGNQISSRMRGEGLVVDVRPDAPPGEPRYLFVTTPGIMGVASQTIYYGQLNYETTFGMEWHERVAFLRENAGQEFAVALEDLPLMVTFLDVADPLSARRVVPNEAGLEFGSEGDRRAGAGRTLTVEEAFGPGVSIQDATVAVMPGEGDGEVTSGPMDAVLPWLGDYHDRQLDGRNNQSLRADEQFANKLASGAFDTGDKF